MKQGFNNKISVYSYIVICWLLVINYVDCQISRKLQKIVNKINNGDMYSLNRAVMIIENARGIRKKFKIWKFFYNNITTNKLMMESIRYSMWQYLYKYVTQLISDEIDIYKVCSFPVPPEKIHYAYFPDSNLLYLSVFNMPSNRIVCKDNVKIVDKIKYTAVKYPENVIKAIIYTDKQRVYVKIGSKYLFGPYKDINGYVYFDDDYKNYAFIYNNGSRLNFNNKQIKLQYLCVHPIGIFRDEVHLLCNSKKYKNSQFLYFNFKKGSVLCSKNSIYYNYSKNGDIVYICRNRNLTSVFFNNHLVKRYLTTKMVFGGQYIYGGMSGSRYVIYSIRMSGIDRGFVDKQVVYDTVLKKVQPIVSDSNIIFLSDDYFYCKWAGSNVIVYKNNAKFKELKLDSDYIQNIYMNKVSDNAFYISLYKRKNRSYSYIVFFKDGTVDTVDFAQEILYTRQNSKKNYVGFIINATDSNGVERCYIYNGKKKKVKQGYHCYYYDKNFNSYIFRKHVKEEDKSIIYISKYKQTVEVKGFSGYNIHDWYIVKKDNLLYLYNYLSNPLAGPVLVLFIPVIGKKAISVPMNNNNVILPVYSSYMSNIISDGLYLLHEFPSSVADKIKEVRGFCKYQKKLCSVD